ncbi:MAG: AtpZ/AtpI family protein [Dehalococcoidia bacterium]|jgi:F0F1-type ATP synthase assembly protein I|tara:strand:- start:340 stop:567 length:228 start_codon:yes stop_codon:yes gene_type:complete
MDLSPLNSVFRFLGIGWYVVICLMGGVFLGNLIDGKVNYNFPIFTIVFTILGAVLAFLGVGLMIRSFIEKNSRGR